MYKDKPSKKSSNATTISDTIKDIMAKNAAPDPVSSPALEDKIDENSSVTIDNNIMDVDKGNTENFNTNQDEPDNDLEFKNEASINNTVS